MGAQFQLSPRHGGAKRRRHPLQSEINVTPFVDVMLVLLIVFMITAPLLTTGVDVSLPKTKANPLISTQEEPLSITIIADGGIYIQEDKIDADTLLPRLRAILNTDYQGRIYVRADARVPYGEVMKILTRIQSGGFSNVALVTDPRTVQEKQTINP